MLRACVRAASSRLRRRLATDCSLFVDKRTQHSTLHSTSVAVREWTSCAPLVSPERQHLDLFTLSCTSAKFSAVTLNIFPVLRNILEFSAVLLRVLPSAQFGVSSAEIFSTSKITRSPLCQKVRFFKGFLHKHIL